MISPASVLSPEPDPDLDTLMAATSLLAALRRHVPPGGCIQLRWFPVRDAPPTAHVEVQVHRPTEVEVAQISALLAAAIGADLGEEQHDSHQQVRWCRRTARSGALSVELTRFLPPIPLADLPDADVSACPSDPTTSPQE